jgi:hypothetical protein
MPKRCVVLIMLLMCLTLIDSSTAKAQSTNRIVIRIPFDFGVPSGVLPAGTYAVERVDPTKPNILMFKNTDTGSVRLFITQRVEKEETSEASYLIFKRWKSEYQLYQVWLVGKKEGDQVPSRTTERRKGSALVQLKVNDSKP